MKKTLFSTSFIVGALLLVGAGCSMTPKSDTTPEPATPNPTTTTETADTGATNGFTLTAELTDAQTVKVTWTKPTDMAEGSVIRLMHSSADNPSFPVTEDMRAPYWYQPGPTRTELSWSSIPVGTRYFRACEFKDNTCIRHSNTVKLEVK